MMSEMKTGPEKDDAHESGMRWKSVGNVGPCSHGHESRKCGCREDIRDREIRRNVENDVEHEVAIDVGLSHEMARTDEVGYEKERNVDHDDESRKDVGRGRANRAEVGLASVC